MPVNIKYNVAGIALFCGVLYLRLKKYSKVNMFNTIRIKSMTVGYIARVI
jgi:hypothetical protein